MRKFSKQYLAKNMDTGIKLGKKILRLWIPDGEDRPFSEKYTFLGYKGSDKNSGVTILAMQGSPIRGFIVVNPLARRVKVFDGVFTEMASIDTDSSEYIFNSPSVMEKYGYCPKLRTPNPCL